MRFLSPSAIRPWQGALAMTTGTDRRIRHPGKILLPESFRGQPSSLTSPARIGRAA